MPDILSSAKDIEKDKNKQKVLKEFILNKETDNKNK